MGKKTGMQLIPLTPEYVLKLTEALEDAISADYADLDWDGTTEQDRPAIEQRIKDRDAMCSRLSDDSIDADVIIAALNDAIDYQEHARSCADKDEPYTSKIRQYEKALAALNHAAE